MAKGNNVNAVSTDTASENTSPTDESERSAREIRQDIAATRDSITDTVDRLNDRFHETLDWRTYVGRYPLVAIGVATGLGLLVSAIFKPRPTPFERMKEALADSVEDFTDNLRSQFDGVVKKPGFSQTVKAAATGLAVKAASDFLTKQFFGSEEERAGESTTTAYPSKMSRTAAPGYRG